MDNNIKLRKIYELLGLEGTEEEYLSNFDNAKFLDIYDSLKKKVGINTALDYLCVLVDAYKFSLNKELADSLLLDEELQDIVTNNQRKKTNKIFDFLARVVDEETEKELEELADSIDEDTKEFPVLTAQEEKAIFRKYDELRKKLADYIYEDNYVEFINYVNNLSQDSTDSFIIKALNRLYSYTCNDEPLVNIRKDKKIVEMVEECREIRDKIDYHNTRLVKKIARKNMNFGLPLEDVEQEGRIGLQRAIEKFDVNRGYKFSTCAIWWINQAIRRALANDKSTIRIPVHLQEKGQKIAKAVKILREQDEIENPSDEEIFEKCKELGYVITISNIKDYKKIELIGNPTSIYAEVGEDEDTSLIEFLSSETYGTTEDFAENNDLHDQFNKILDDIAKLPSKNVYTYKEVIFVTKKAKTIRIILTEEEFEELIHNARLNKREKVLEFFNKYGLNMDNLTPAFTVKDINLTTNERGVLIFRLRTGITNSFADRFLNERNYNNAFFIPTNKELLTLEKVGELFGVTRERIRQIEEKYKRKVASSLGKKKTPVFCISLCVEDNEIRNVYDELGISNVADYSFETDTSEAIRCDRGGNITVLKKGRAKITVTNIHSANKRILDITIYSRKERIKEAVSNKPTRLIFKPENKKDNQ